MDDVIFAIFLAFINAVAETELDKILIQIW